MRSKGLNKHKPLAPVFGDAAYLSDEVWEALEEQGVVTSHMTFSNPEKLSKWGNPERLELSEIIASKKPIPDLSPTLTKTRLISLDDIHIAFKDQNGDLTGVNQALKRRPGKSFRGMLIRDEKDRLWFCGDTPEAARIFTGSEPLRRMKDQASPMMELAESVRRGTSFSLADTAAMIGPIEIFLNEVTSVKNAATLISPAEKDSPDAPSKLKLRVRERIKAAVAREDQIARIVARHMTDEKLSNVLGEVSGKFISGMMPDYADHKRRSAFDDRLMEFSIALMGDLRDAGILAPCPNNGPREVGPLHAWNAFIKGDPDSNPNGELAFEKVMMRHALNRAPAFQLIRNIMVRTSIDMGDAIWLEDNPEKAPHMRDVNDKDRIPVSRIPDLFRAIREGIVESFSTEDPGTNLLGSDGLEGRSDGTRYILAGSFLTPVLAMQPKSIHDNPTPLPILEEPKYIRHLELEMPSGILVMADWFRIEGFNEGLKAMIGADDHYEINTASGLDARARDYCEKAGIAIVQVGNTSPKCYSGGERVWRMGYLDEDHEDFWNEDGEPAALERPAQLWGTCTDLWANTFGDREAVISILEASGKYETRAAAEEALDAYTLVDCDAAQVDLGVDRLHLYLPTGPGIHKGNFNDVFRADEITHTEWMEDYYILSGAPLSVDPDLVEDCSWTCKDLSDQSLHHDMHGGPQ